MLTWESEMVIIECLLCGAISINGREWCECEHSSIGDTKWYQLSEGEIFIWEVVKL